MLFYETLRVGIFATRFVGGESYNRDHKGDPGARPPVVVTPAAKQREALKILCDRYLHAPPWAWTPSSCSCSERGAGRTGARTRASELRGPGRDPVGPAVHAVDAARARPPDAGADQALKVDAGSEPFTVGELFDTLTRTTFSELDNKPPAPFDAAHPSSTRSIATCSAPGYRS